MFWRIDYWYQGGDCLGCDAKNPSPNNQGRWWKFGLELILNYCQITQAKWANMTQAQYACDVCCSRTLIIYWNQQCCFLDINMALVVVVDMSSILAFCRTVWILSELFVFLSYSSFFSLEHLILDPGVKSLSLCDLYYEENCWCVCITLIEVAAIHVLSVRVWGTILEQTGTMFWAWGFSRSLMLMVNFGLYIWIKNILLLFLVIQFLRLKVML